MTAAPYAMTKDDQLDIDGVIRVGISWDTSARGMGGFLGKLSRKVGTDLDLVAIGMRADGEPVRMAGLDNLDPFGNGSLAHSGDNQSGHGAGDDETVTVRLDQVPGNIHAIVFVAAAYKKHASFKDADNIAFHVYGSEQATAPDMAFWPSLRNAGTNNACVIMRADRVGSGWKMRPIDKMTHVNQGDKDHLLTVAMRTS
jgi:stress response protein SCP2